MTEYEDLDESAAQEALLGLKHENVALTATHIGIAIVERQCSGLGYP